MTQKTADYLFLSLGMLVLVSAFIASAISKDLFFTYFGAEDSLIETLTAIFLACAGAVLVARVLRVRETLTRGALVLGLLYGLAYFWAAGEEISWGQRILGFESPEYFQENNDQQEFTLHNLVIGGVKLDEVIFGPVLSWIILSYLIILPVLWRWVGWVQRVTKAMAVPVPRLYHSVFAIIVSVAIPMLAESRRWEVYECIFALLSLAIFIHPANPLRDTTSAQAAPEMTP